ncbi:hypothetical protein NLJ89_g6855 [Agrocybe chaxingu]|uniref:Uncharacterized protein n=1 Tax=Agrocybe chaxingu TaxID=84603 RepID=A0A9W8JXU2_9AGAR|nr:hypothetical protein NLJ89_g6855 [Agrocybe chaxingu]
MAGRFPVGTNVEFIRYFVDPYGVHADLNATYKVVDNTETTSNEDKRVRLYMLKLLDVPAGMPNKICRVPEHILDFTEI